MTTKWIAEEAVVVIYPDGRRTGGRIAIGEPRPTDDGFARCGIHIDFILPKADALQLAGMLLHDFLARGGRVLFADGLILAPLPGQGGVAETRQAMPG